MKIAIGKINGEIFFDRNVEGSLRSSSNGHKSTFAIYDTIINKLNLDVNVNGIGKNDKYKYKTYKSDLGFFVTGGIKNDDNDSVVKYINKYKLKYILYADDPRCLDLVNENTNIKRLPKYIMSQFNGKYIFHDKEYEIININQELSELRDVHIDEINFNNKVKNKINILCNMSSDDETNRQLSLIPYYNYFKEKGIEINVYGKTPQKLLNEYPNIFKGIIGCNEAEEKLKESIITLCMPIKKGWSTSKYVECINNYTIPIFTNDYNVDEFMKKFVVNSPEELYNIFTLYSNEAKYMTTMNEFIYYMLNKRDKFIKNLKEIINEN